MSWLCTISVEWNDTRSFSSLLGVRSDHKRDFLEIWNAESSTTIILMGSGHWWFTHFVTDLLPHLIGRIQWLCPQVSELWPSPPFGYLIWGQIGVLLFGKDCQLLPQIAFVVEFGSRVPSLSSWVPMCPWHFWLPLSHSHFMSRFSSCLPSLLT